MAGLFVHRVFLLFSLILLVFSVLTRVRSVVMVEIPAGTPSNWVVLVQTDAATGGLT